MLGWGILLKLALTALVWASGKQCLEVVSTSAEAAIRAPLTPFVKDVARYLTGREDNAEKVFQEYRRKRRAGDPDLWQPPVAPAVEITDHWRDLQPRLGVDLTETAPPDGKWHAMRDGRWLMRTVFSAVKGGKRFLYRSRPKHNGGLEASVTRSKDGEIEIALKRVTGEDWDFFSFNEHGERQGFAVFATTAGTRLEAPTPLSCVACHYNRATRAFGRYAFTAQLASAMAHEQVFVRDLPRLGFPLSATQQ